MGQKRWRKVGIALIVMGFLIILLGWMESYRIPHGPGPLADEVRRRNDREMLWVSTGQFAIGTGAIVVSVSLLFRRFVKPPGPPPDGTPESN